MKTIGQIAELFNLPISTLRYYDKEGLFPDLQRKAEFVILASQKSRRYE